MKTCPDCNGDGVIEKGTDDERQCPTCGGSGFVPDDDDDEEIIRTVSARLGPHKLVGLLWLTISGVRLPGRRSTVRPSRFFPLADVVGSLGLSPCDCLFDGEAPQSYVFAFRRRNH